MDNGPELISQRLANWAERSGVLLDFIEPGKSAQNAYIERFNRTYREDVLDFYLFSSLADRGTKLPAVADLEVATARIAN